MFFLVLKTFDKWLKIIYKYWLTKNYYVQQIQWILLHFKRKRWTNSLSYKCYLDLLQYKHIVIWQFLCSTHWETDGIVCVHFAPYKNATRGCQQKRGNAKKIGKIIFKLPIYTQGSFFNLLLQTPYLCGTLFSM